MFCTRKTLVYPTRFTYIIICLWFLLEALAMPVCPFQASGTNHGPKVANDFLTAFSVILDFFFLD